MIDRFAVVSVFLVDQASAKKSVRSDEIMRRVISAGETRASRGQVLRNGEVSFADMIEYLNTNESYIDAFTKNVHSHRSRMQIMQVARTYADIDNSEKTKREHFRRAFDLTIGSRELLLKCLAGS